MKNFLIHPYRFLIAFILASFSVSASAQTVALNDGITLQPNTNRVGINIGSITFYDNGQLLKNLIGSFNPGFEPLINVGQIADVGVLISCADLVCAKPSSGAQVTGITGAAWQAVPGTQPAVI